MNADPTASSALAHPALHVLRLTLPAAPVPLVLRRDRTAVLSAEALDPADVLRYVGAARRTRRGPLIAEFEGPGDPLASPGHVLRALALLREHDPDVLTGLVIDGPLLADYLDELLDLGIHHVVVRMDATSVKAAWRVYGRILYRGELIVGPDAGRLVLEEGRRAVRLLVAERVPVALRFTAIPTVNVGDLASVAEFAASAGAERLDVVPHVPVLRAPLSRAGTPTRGEMAGYRETVARVFAEVRGEEALPGEDGASRRADALGWMSDGRLQEVALASLDAVDPMSLLPDPEVDLPPEARILPPRRARIVAVATNDGQFVDRTLLDAQSLQIFAVGDDAPRLLGTRSLPTGILRRRDGVGVPRDFLAAVAGCHAVVATRFTKKAATLLDAVGIRPYVAGGPIDEVLDCAARGALGWGARGRSESADE